MLVLSGITHWIFWVDDTNCYQRGTLFFIPYIVAALYILIAIGLVFYAIKFEKVTYRKKQRVLILLFMLLPIMAILFQEMYEGIWIVLPITAIAELLEYVQIQRQQITMDTLTGINNRICFDNYLKDLMERKESKQSFYLFMMDLVIC